MVHIIQNRKLSMVNSATVAAQLNPTTYGSIPKLFPKKPKNNFFLNFFFHFIQQTHKKIMITITMIYASSLSQVGKCPPVEELPS